VLRRLRRRSLAAARKEVEPVPPSALGRFLPQWQSVGSKLRGADGVLAVVEQLSGCAVPASALEPFILGSRLVGYSPSMLDELTSAGEVIWAGAGALPGTDGWVSLHTADTAALTLPDLGDVELSELHDNLLRVLSGGGGYFFRQLSDAVSSTNDEQLTSALWDLVWAGHVTNDTIAPLRAHLHGRGTHRPRPGAPRARLGARAAPLRGGMRRPTMPTRTGPPSTVGRWSLTPPRDVDPTRRAHAAAEGLLERHGVVTRGAVLSERTPGGFAAVYRVLSAFEEAGRCRRGYFVDKLGAAQFGVTGAVDRLRSVASDAEGAGRQGRQTLVLAATDPANPFGAALPWPDRAVDAASAGHRPGRKAGAIVVMVDGALALYVERGGRTLLSFTQEHDEIQPAVDALALAVRDGALGKLTVERADGEHILGSPLSAALEAAGFYATPRGLRLRR
jgi:ATP-dependent helicase Lhr and Lhr-like helicase